ncbi:phage tail protein [Burkholderia sp. JPY481]
MPIVDPSDMRVYVNPVWWANRAAPHVTVTEAQWVRRIEAAARARVAGATFGWCPTACSATVTPQIIETPFGDGYKQRRPAGLRTQFPEWELEFTDRRIPEALQITGFLVARNGVDVFNWSPPRLGYTLDVLCPEWSWSYGSLLADGSRSMSVTATFVEAYA